jgi:hypothetical protein
MRTRSHHSASLSYGETGEDRWGEPIEGLLEPGESERRVGEEYLAADVAVASLQ